MSLVRIRPSLPTKPRVFPGFFLFIPSPKLSVRQPNGRFLIVPALLLSLRRSPPQKKHALAMLKLVSASCFFFRPLRHNSAYKKFSRLISRRFSSSPKAPDANCLYSCLVVQKPKEKTEKTYIFFFEVTIFTTRIKTTKKNKNGPNKNPGETGVSICSKRYRKLFRSRQALNRSKRGKSQQYGGSADQNIYDTAQNAH